MKVLLASMSPIKIEAVKRIFPEHNLSIVDCSECNLPEQPFDCGAFCAKTRLQFIKKRISGEYDFIVSIENSIDIVDNEYKDRCHVMIEHKDLFGYSSGSITYLVHSYVTDKIQYVNQTDKIKGLVPSIGEIYHQFNSDIDPKNWMKNVYGIDRVHQITESIRLAYLDLQSKLIIARELMSLYKSYPNYPKEGVIFEDFFAVIRERDNLQKLIKLVVDQVRFDEFDYIVGPESRGFFGFGISCMGGYGFIPIRKAGKLPGSCHSISYDKEYGSDTLEIQADIPIGSRVLVFDDLIGTGGSLKAVRDLLELSKCVIVNYVVLREVAILRSQAIQTLGCPYTVLLRD